MALFEDSVLNSSFNLKDPDTVLKYSKNEEKKYSKIYIFAFWKN